MHFSVEIYILCRKLNDKVELSLIKDKILSLSIVCSFFEPSIHFLSIQELGVHLKGMIYTLINIYLISEEVETLLGFSFYGTSGRYYSVFVEYLLS